MKHIGTPVAYFIRHGETEGNEKDVFRGDIDFPLNKEGQEQAQKLIKFFRRDRFSKIYGSDRKRVLQTLEPLAKNKKMKIIKANNLESLNTGDFSGLPKSDENLKRIKWYNKHPNVMIPGGESVQAFRDRVDPMLESICKQGEEAGVPVAVGCHGSVLKELYRWLYGKIESKARVEPGGVVAILRGSHGYEAIPILGSKDKEDQYREMNDRDDYLEMNDDENESEN